jgi:hypothetical protein
LGAKRRNRQDAKNAKDHAKIKRGLEGANRTRVRHVVLWSSCLEQNSPNLGVVLGVLGVLAVPSPYILLLPRVGGLRGLFAVEGGWGGAG